MLEVQTAFSLLMPLPSSGPRIISRLAIWHRSSAVKTSDAGVALRVQLIERHVMLLDVVPDIDPGQICHGAKFDDLVLRIPADNTRR